MLLHPVLFLIHFYLHFSEADQMGSINFYNNACYNLSSYPLWFLNSLCYVDLDAFSPVPDIITRNGYKAETHEVITEDGYILTLYRIPPKEDDCRQNKQPVIFQHGLGADGGVFLARDGVSSAISLARMGYDVWLANSRGTPPSSSHITIAPSEARFWNFSIDELALYDFVANIDTVAKVTGQAGNIILVTHSVGSMSVFMYSSTFPEHAETNVRGLVVLSPVTYVHSYLKDFLTRIRNFVEVMLNFGFSVVFSNQDLVHRLLQYICTLAPFRCWNFINSFFGISYQRLPESLLTFYSSFPRPFPVKEFTHLTQIWSSNKLQKFDYGPERNLQVYGQRDPPVYDLSRVKLPVFIRFGLNENLINQTHVDMILQELGSNVKNGLNVPIGNTRPEDQFDHIDFYLARDLDELFNKDLLLLFRTELGSRGKC